MELPEQSTVSSLIEFLKLPRERLAIELNREVVRKLDWENRVLTEGDRVEIVHFVGGG